MLWIKKKNWRVEQEVKKCHFRAGILNWNQKMDSDVILKPGPELKSAQISIQGGAEQRVEMGFFCVETFFNFFQKQKKKFWDFKSGGYEKWQGMAGMGQRWDLNPGLSREVRELSWDWELIFLELFLFVETFFKRKKKKKRKLFKRKKEEGFEIGWWWWQNGRDGPGVRFESRAEQRSQRVEMRWELFFLETFSFCWNFFQKKKKRKLFKKKKKGFEIRWWWWQLAGMGQRWDLNPGLSREVRELRFQSDGDGKWQGWARDEI